MTSRDHAHSGQSMILPLFLVAAGVYAQRDGKILILERAAGAMVGFWSMPGGLVDAGETPEATARRELFEEAGLRPTGPLALVGVTPVHIYGHDCFRLVYACACDCAEGDVVLSDEHSAAQWIDPVVYRMTHLSDAQTAVWRARSPPEATIVEAVRATFDDYLAWRAHHRG